MRFVVRSFSTNSRPACGRPPPAAVLGRQQHGITGELASPATEPERRLVGEQPIAAVFMRM
jgi:hypothetical protein